MKLSQISKRWNMFTQHQLLAMYSFSGALATAEQYTTVCIWNIWGQKRATDQQSLDSYLISTAWFHSLIWVSWAVCVQMLIFLTLLGDCVHLFWSKMLVLSIAKSSDSEQWGSQDVWGTRAEKIKSGTACIPYTCAPSWFHQWCSCIQVRALEISCDTFHWVTAVHTSISPYQIHIK